jgi:glycerol uptake facilitator-like aquaporin
MSHIILGIIGLFAGVGVLLLTYKNRYKITNTNIFFKQDVYEVVNEKGFLRLQNIISLFVGISFISISILGLWWSPKVYILAAMISGASHYIFSLLCMKYVKPKAKVYL